MSQIVGRIIGNCLLKRQNGASYVLSGQSVLATDKIRIILMIDLTASRWVTTRRNLCKSCNNQELHQASPELHGKGPYTELRSKGNSLDGKTLFLPA